MKNIFKPNLISIFFIAVWFQPAYAYAASTTHVDEALPFELEKPEDEFNLDIIKYEVNGLDAKHASEIEKITAIYTGENKSYEDISNAAAAVTRHMQKELGYYVGSAYIPTQKPNQKIIQLQAMKGVLAEVVVNIENDDEKGSYKNLINQRISTLKSGNILYTKDIERAALLLNDIGGLSLKFSLQPGKKAGSVNIIITAKANKKNDYDLGIDSFGNKTYGRYRLSAGTQKYGLLKAGDKLRLEFKGSHNADFKLAALGYERPLENSAWNLGLILAHVRWQGESLFDNRAYTTKGQASILGSYGIYPWVRSRNLNTFAMLTYQHKNFSNEFSFAPSLSKHSNNLSIGLIGDIRDGWAGGAINTYNMQVTTGHINSQDRAVIADTHFSKATWSLSRLQNLVPMHLQWYTKFQGQMTGARLDSSEYFIAAGHDNVRAFGAGLAAGEKGYLITNEIRWFPSSNFFGDLAKEIRFSIFHDWARVKYVTEKNTSPTENPSHLENRILSGYGIGLTRENPYHFSLNLNISWRKHQIFHQLRHDSSPRIDFNLNKKF